MGTIVHKHSGTHGKRCHIVERHNWETGGRQQQLQFVLDTAAQFFGSGEHDTTIHIRVFLSAGASTPAFEKDIVISRVYGNGTRRTNRFPEMGAIPESFVFFQETDGQNTYDVWWQTDKAIVAAKYDGWTQGRNTQYGRGRLSVIVQAPVPRIVHSL